MTDQDSVEARKAASAAGAVDNSGVGVDGDGPSVADGNGDHVNPPGDQDAHEAPPDPVTATTDNAVGANQAADNEDEEPAS